MKGKLRNFTVCMCVQGPSLLAAACAIFALSFIPCSSFLFSFGEKIFKEERNQLVIHGSFLWENPGVDDLAAGIRDLFGPAEKSYSRISKYLRQ